VALLFHAAVEEEMTALIDSSEEESVTPKKEVRPLTPILDQRAIYAPGSTPLSITQLVLTIRTASQAKWQRWTLIRQERHRRQQERYRQSVACLAARRTLLP
jgi:hypothetical protein